MARVSLRLCWTKTLEITIGLMAIIDGVINTVHYYSLILQKHKIVFNVQCSPPISGIC